LLLAKDKYGIIVWHRAAEIGSLKPLVMLCSLAKEAEINLDYLVLMQVDFLQDILLGIFFIFEITAIMLCRIFLVPLFCILFRGYLCLCA
jgi:hypothetical protein